MSSRDAILARLRANRQETSPVVPLPPADADVFLDLPEDDLNERVECFRQHLQALKGEFCLVLDARGALDQMRRLLSGAEPGPWYRQDHPLLASVLAGDPELAARFRPVADLPPGAAAADCAVGLTTADFLVARTGSLIVRSTNAGGRRLSVLPPLHLVLARTAGVVGTLADVFRQWPAADDGWSYTAVVTGPSRTADIEKILVLGAHGPKRLAVVLMP